MNLSAASNTEIPAYELLIELGYEVAQLNSNSADVLWLATRNGDKFKANGLIELLGIVKLAECKGENWQVSDDKIDIFLSKF
ncbi:hypothetical protein [Shewanella gelidii]|uniref:Uncharacterized protein n=1 Tax=Shewanella gelidii TaxID=1642821 RepID=A0A917NCJ6_9GAMM|nr:hypothetical protein [Shewanella gelidii]MCL1099699.1 hypothetical protein [Shewanella gelidii]GGI89289.1 hypothetical protein GCM10009332_28370 [Shewanella gelidii]